MQEERFICRMSALYAGGALYMQEVRGYLAEEHSYMPEEDAYMPEVHGYMP
jgi:hypothetical protein